MSLRICQDPRNLNKSMKLEHFQLPVIEELFADMHGVKYFFKVHASNDFWQIPVDNGCSKLFPSNIPFGRYRFTSLPYGKHSVYFRLKSAVLLRILGEPEMFRKL